MAKKAALVASTVLDVDASAVISGCWSLTYAMLDAIDELGVSEILKP